MPLPRIKSPAVVMGDKALKPADAVVWPVPPLAIATVPVTFAALPLIFPLTCEPGKLSALNVVNVELLDAVTLAAVPVVFWFSVGNVQLVSVPDEGVPNAPSVNKTAVPLT